MCDISYPQLDNQTIDKTSSPPLSLLSGQRCVSDRIRFMGELEGHVLFYESTIRNVSPCESGGLHASFTSTSANSQGLSRFDPQDESLVG